MKRTFSMSLAMLIALLGLTFTADAVASAPRASATVGAEQAWHIDMATNRALLQVSEAAVSQAEHRASVQMSPCLTSVLAQITEAAQSNANADKALESLGEEAGVQYEMAAITPVMRPLLGGMHRLLALNLPAALRSEVKSYLSALAKVQSLNTCADARAWFAADLTKAKEPAGTRQIATTLADFHKVTSDNVVELGDLPAAQLHALKLEKTQADKHANQLIARSVVSLESWTKRLLLKVETIASATMSTTTTTPATTTVTTLRLRLRLRPPRSPGR